MKILIAPCSRLLRNGRKNPRDYPWFSQLSENLKTKHEVTLLGNNIPLNDLFKYVHNFDLVMTIDSMIQHLCWYEGVKCLTIFSKSDPLIFGHKENYNLLKDRKYLRKNQFDIWEVEEYEEQAFLTPDEIIKKLEGDYGCRI